jgi:2-polyprenyl-3-methyl-5-hydroxy-6-metoxy-1,4-benzoquinol methylase
MKREDKKDLYAVYQSTHFGFIRDERKENYKNSKKIFEAYYGKFLPEKNAKIIDIACGSGTFLNWLKDKGYIHILGIDISKEQIKLAKEKLGSEIILTADAFDFLKTQKNTYDMIVALDLIEHFEKEEILELLKSAYRALNPGGKLLLSVPNAETLFGGTILYGDFTHEIAFTQESLSQILRFCGFKTIKFLETEPIINNPKSLFRFIIWKIIKQLIKIYFLASTGSVGSGRYYPNISVLAIK